MENQKFISRQNLGKTIYWSPWLGCHKISEACLNCNVDVTRPFIAKRYSTLRLENAPAGSVILTAFSTDFFLEEADPYREQAWETIKTFPNLIFLIITKRVDRISKCLPVDWNEGYSNVILSITVETNQKVAERLPIFAKIPAKHKWLSVAPILEDINLSTYLKAANIECVEVLGEKCFSLNNTKIRPCYYSWFKHLAEQCKEADLRFSILACGDKFNYNESWHSDNSACYHSILADSLNLDIVKPITFNLKDITVTI